VPNGKLDNTGLILADLCRAGTNLSCTKAMFARLKPNLVEMNCVVIAVRDGNINIATDN
jgi:hypothetical protein